MRFLILMVALIATLTSCKQKGPFQKTTAIMRGDTLVVDGPAILINEALAKKKILDGAPKDLYNYKMIRDFLNTNFQGNDTLLVYSGAFNFIKFEPKYAASKSEASCSDHFYFLCSVDQFGNISFTDNFEEIHPKTGIVEYINTSDLDSKMESDQSIDKKSKDSLSEPVIIDREKAAKDALYRKEMEKENKK